MRTRRLLLALFVLALAVRLFGLRWDQDHFFHPDERRIAEAVSQLSFHPLQLHPHFFAYGSFPFYVSRAVLGLVGLVRPALVCYDGAVWVGRAVSALWGALGVLALAALGRRLFGEKTAHWAAFFLAVAILPVQNAHFATNDVALTTLITMALLLLVRTAEEDGLLVPALAGLAIGFSVATKVSALPLGLPAALALLFRHRRAGSRAWIAALLIGGGALAGFLLGEPYALLDSRAFLADVSEQSRMVRAAGIVPYTTQYTGTLPYLYPLVEILLWGLAPALGLAALWGTLRILRDRAAWKTPGTAVVLGFLVPYFAITGAFSVKFPRYMLPVYPLLLLFAAEGLSRLPGPGGRRLRAFVAAGGLACLVAFLRIYTKDHTVVTASRWAYDTLRPGARILSQDWDEGFPFPMPGEKNPDRFRITNFPFYEPDGPQKTDHLSEELARADYVVFQTKRLYGAITRAPERYPATDRFFRLFFAGDLGYVLEKDVASRPGIGPLSAPDELADESFTVYDHPRVLVYRNSARLPAGELRHRLLEAAPHRELTRNQILLGAPPEFASRALPDTAIRSSLLAVLVLALLLQLLGWVGTTFVLRLLPQAPAPAALGKVVGVSAYALLAWLGASTGLLPFRRLPLMLLFAALLAVAARIRMGLDRGVPRGSRTEAVFWGAFALFLVCRAFAPEIFWGEKPMDFAFLNALERSVSMPPPEPWFSGSPLHYTYFGHFVVACLGKTAGIAPAVLFNLGIATFAALFAAALLFAGTVVGGSAGAGLGTVCLGLVAGNLNGLPELWQRRVLNFDFFWATSRVVPAGINEYPLWSFLFADLHAHVLALPFAAAFAGVAVLLSLRREEQTPPRLPELALAALLLGAVFATNGWSIPTYTALLAGLFFLHAWRAPAAAWWERLRLSGEALRSIAVVLALAWALWLPFWSRFESPVRQWGREVGPWTRPHELGLVFGLFLALLLPLLVRGSEDSHPNARQARAFLLGFLLVLGTISLPRLVHGRIAESGSVHVLATGLALWCAIAAWQAAEPGRRSLLGLATLAFTILAGCELVYVWDRMNTVFKFYLDAEILLAVALGGALASLFGTGGAGRAARILGRAALAFALLTTGTALYSGLGSHHVEGPRATLDGTAYLPKHAADDAGAIAWLNRSVPGLPTIVEAWGPSYQEFARITMHTGLPSVIGWDYHVQQRAHPREAIERRKADVAALYGATSSGVVREVVERYAVSYVVCGPLEEKTYGSPRQRLDQFTDVLRPVYQGTGTVVYAVVPSQGGGSISARVDRATPVVTSLPPRSAAARAPDQGAVLQEPRGIFRSAEGTVYVADFGKDRVALFDSALRYLESWGERGEQPGALHSPSAVAVGKEGRVYVADTWNGRVQVFDRAGRRAFEISDDFFGPRGVAISPEGDVFVSDTGNGRIVRFTPEGTRRLVFGNEGDRARRLKDPVGLAFDPTGTLWVCDNGNGRLVSFSRDGAFLKAIPVPGWRTAPLSEPHVAFDRRGSAWITVPLENEVRTVDTATGQVVRTIRSGETGQEPFDRPLGIAVDPRTQLVLVSDVAGRLSWLRPVKSVRF